MGEVESGGNNMGGQVVDGGGAGGAASIDPLVILTKTNDIFIWLLLQVVFPLFCLIGLSVVVFCLIMKIEGAFEHLIGNGVLLTFGGLLLIGVFRAISQARSFIQKYNREIGPSKLAWTLLIVGIALLLLYAMNSTVVNLCELLPEMDPDLYGGLHEWTIVGIAGSAIAVVLSLAGIICMNRALRFFAHRVTQGGSV